jgi:hypothetical protein
MMIPTVHRRHHDLPVYRGENMVTMSHFRSPLEQAAPLRLPSLPSPHWLQSRCTVLVRVDQGVNLPYFPSAMDWIVSLYNLHFETLAPNMMVLEMGPWFRWGHKSGALMIGLVPIKRRASRELSLSPPSENTVRSKQGGGPHQNQLKPPASGTVRK